MASPRQPYEPSFEVPIMLLGDTRPPVVITEPFRDLTLDGDDVFVALVSGQLLRIRLSDGVFQHIDGGDHWVAEEVVVSDGTVFVTGAQGVFAIDREGNGARQLLPPPPQGAQRTLLVEGSFLYAAQWLSDPSVLYRVATDGSGATIVARHARMYYMASDAGSVYFQFGESPSRWTIAALDHPGVQP